MISFSLFNQISVILVSLFSFLIAIIVYFADKKSKINLYFSWLAIFISLWIILTFFASTNSNLSIGAFLSRLAYGSVALLFIPFYFFSINFLKEEKKHKFINLIVPACCLFLFFFSIVTKLMVDKMTLTAFGPAPVLGQGKNIYFAIIFLLLIFITVRFFKNYFIFPKQEKLRVQYFLIGFFIWIFANLIFNIILPAFQNTPQFWSVGNYSAIFLLTFTAYAIVKRELFGIKVIIATIFVGAITILLGIDALVFTDQISIQLFKGLILVIFIYFGYLLVKSVAREIQQRQEIEKLSSAKSEFIAIASHQLRTPLTAVKGYISMILEGSYGKIPEKAKAPMEKVYQQNEKLVKLVNDLLSLSRLESGKLQLELGLASTEDLISSIVGIFDVQAKDKNLYLKFEKPKEQIPLVMMDADKNRQVISNIINNCLKYTEKGGVTIKLKTINGKLQIEISDTGLGMEEAEIGKLFQSFSRGEAGARTDAGGAGLGLHIAKKFIELQGGKVWAESAGKGKGSQFYIELPINNHNNHK